MNRHAVFALSALCLSSGFSLSRAATAATITVNTTDDEQNADSDCSLREAIIAANTNAVVDACAKGDSGADSIVVPAGSYLLSRTGTGENAANTGDLDITEDLTITGAGASTTIIEGGAGTVTTPDRVFHVLGGNVTFQDLTIRRGDAGAGDGGGIGNEGPGSLTLERCNVFDNLAASGGGLSNIMASATLTVTDSQIRGNRSSTSGGGIETASATNLMSGSTLSSNQAVSGFGGGMHCSDSGAGSRTTVTGSTISGNQASVNGGGLYSSAETAEIMNSTVSENLAANVGGGVSVSAKTVALTGSAFLGNLAANGPGGGFVGSASLAGTSLSITDCSFEGNSAMFTGGGGTTIAETVTITGSTFQDNIAGTDGGGFMSSAANGATIDVVNSTFAGNTGLEYGGGIFISSEDASFTNVTLFDNFSDSLFGDAGGIYFDGIHEATLRNTIIAGNLGGNCGGGGTFTSLGHNIESANDCSLAPGEWINTDPLLSILQDNGGATLTLAPLPGSPAIDGGDDTGCPPADQRGIPRPLDGDEDGMAACDIGAVEFSHCGDGFADAHEREECDDGNSDDTDACTNTCTNAVCGDGFVEAGVEQCDDGNTVDADGCSATCTTEEGGTTGGTTGGTATGGTSGEDGGGGGCSLVR
ncbi:MAG TPA: choice-of-anchor Q domain-containing protein [bacterium]|nr:choice-of-anchor Q domain-containing protein [bacterium]